MIWWYLITSKLSFRRYDNPYNIFIIHIISNQWLHVIQAIWCTKEVSSKTRVSAYALIVEMGKAVNRLNGNGEGMRLIFKKLFLLKSWWFYNYNSCIYICLSVYRMYSNICEINVAWHDRITANDQRYNKFYFVRSIRIQR